jgi:hypothetical protein
MSTNKYGFTPSEELQQGLDTLHLLLELFKPDEMEEMVWYLSFQFANSKTESEWTYKERSNFHCFYTILVKACRAIVVIDKELGRGLS